MKNYLKIALLLILGLWANGAIQAQQAFTLQQSIDYALKNQQRIKVAQNETEIAKAKIGEIRSAGLPQINFGADLGNNFILQKSPIPAGAFTPPSYALTQNDVNQANSGQTVTLKAQQGDRDPDAPEFIYLAFGQPWTGSAAITGSQLLFDGSYLIGLKAASTFSQLSKKQLVQTEIEVAEQVAKAYYAVLVSRERQKLLDQNLVRLDTLLYQTRQMNKEGFAEKLDVDRLTVSYNNLKIEKQKTDRLIELSEMLLKFQMGMNQQEPIILTDKLANVEVDMNKLNQKDFNYSSRIEYSILETQRDLAILDIKNIRAGYYPQVVLNGRYGYSGFSNSLGGVLDVRGGANNTTDRNWFDFGYIGLGVNVPIFDGLRKNYQSQQAKLRLENAKAGLKLTEQNIDLELNSSSTSLANALQQLESQKENLDLAQEIARVSKIKYQEGVGSNLEVITAETDLRQAQTNYYAALYDALIAKVDLEKATGSLLSK